MLQTLTLIHYFYRNHDIAAMYIPISKKVASVVHVS